MADLGTKSNSSMQVFDNPQFGKVRTVTGADGEPWFVTADVCKCLELTNTSMALTRLDEDEKDDISLTDAIGRKQQTSIVNESGLYILVMGSRKPEAKAFRRWIAHDVLPSIRKHGAYMVPSLVDQMLADPDTMIRLLTELKAEREKSAALADKVEEQAVELNESERYWTIAKYNRMNKLEWSLDICKKAGKEASRYARLHNYQVKRCETNDERFGWVNSYNLDMLNMLFRR